MTENSKPKEDKFKQLEELLLKSEKRADRLKALNDQIKKQLEFEKEKNDEFHQDLTNLKQQLFKSQKDYKEVKEQLEIEMKRQQEIETKKQENESKEQDQKQLEINLCQKCQQLLVQGTPNLQNMQKYLSPHLSSNMLQNLYTQNGNMGANIFTFKQNESPNLKRNDSQLSISSQSSQISDEEDTNNAVLPPENFERTRKRTMTISVRFNNDKGADHIRAISKSIVARNYESEYQDGIIQSPFKDTKLALLKSLANQADSHTNFEEPEKEENGEEQQQQQQPKNGSQVDEHDSFQNTDSQNTSQELPQIQFNKKTSSNKTSQFKQQMHIKFQRRQSRTHSTIRSTIEHIEDIDSGVGSQNQIKSIVFKKSNPSMSEDLSPIAQGKTPKHSTPAGEQEIQVNNFDGVQAFNIGSRCDNKVDDLPLNQIPEEMPSLSTSNAVSMTQTNKLFEKFFVIGSDKDDMKEFDLDANTTEGLLPGRIVYSYPELNSEDPQDQVLKVIHEFALPKGIKSKKIRISSSFKKITQYVLSSSKAMIQNKFYMFTMKSNSFYDQTPKDQSVLSAINPHKLMYCFCFKTRDYIETTTDESYFQPQNHKQRSFWETKKVYCFVTYYPFHELFQEMLINVLNQVKISRTTTFSEFETSDPKILYKLDGDYIKTIIRNNMESFFSSYRKITVTDFQQIIMIDTLAGPFKYIIGNKSIITTQTHKWSLGLSLSNMSLQNLMFLFHAILLENTIIFTSKNKCLLTQTIHTFEQIIHPFSWPYPIIYLLPDTLQTLFDSPVPIIMGVNKSTHQLMNEDTYQRYPDHIFVDLDMHRMYCNNKQVVKTIFNNQAYMNNLQAKIEKVYQQINPNGLIQKKPSMFSDPSSKESEKHKEEYQLKYFCSKQDEQISEIILNIFNESLRQCFVEILPKKIENLINQEDNQIDYSAFSETVFNSAYEQDKLFVKNFINTQIFTYFMENHYQLD